ncbi:urease subunit beta [Streptomyces sp. AC550_RSS872]|uniref:urease subunit beta n=1 Tax=Streptomyces sp. AC550_RSS872 TaxID=2823689 RepID=UPI001C27D04E|nr:urease subunit beta [Streptomyces sp. AC550_RSS872]
MSAGEGPDRAPQVPGEVLLGEGDVELNRGRAVTVVAVVNAADRPVQVGSHYHFAEANPGLSFDRAAAHGKRLNIPAGTAARFEPGVPAEVELVPLGGRREVFGLRAETKGSLDTGSERQAVTKGSLDD